MDSSDNVYYYYDFQEFIIYFTNNESLSSDWPPIASQDSGQHWPGLWQQTTAWPYVLVQALRLSRT